jgi:23S rRNA pseudouridine1911/1915/1917 synthase
LDVPCDHKKSKLKNKRMKYTLKNNATLLEAVMEMYKGMSRQKAKQVIGHSRFSINGIQIEKIANQSYSKGDILEIDKLESSPDQKFIPSRSKPVSIYFEDEYMVVALKPAGILSCGNKTDKSKTSFHRVLEEYLQKRDEKKIRLWIVHRLDKEVEGLNLFAKSENIQIAIKDNWQQVTKKYLAIAEAKPEPESGVIENWLREVAKQKVVGFNKEVPDSKFAKTEYHYIRAEKPYHLLEIQIYTGRKNQIRVHLAGIGCPIVGDRRYGADDSVLRQIRLAAYKLEFIHPVTKNTVSMEYTPIARFFKPSKTTDESYKVI